MQYIFLSSAHSAPICCVTNISFFLDCLSCPCFYENGAMMSHHFRLFFILVKAQEDYLGLFFILSVKSATHLSTPDEVIPPPKKENPNPDVWDFKHSILVYFICKLQQVSQTLTHCHPICRNSFFIFFIPEIDAAQHP